MPSGLVRVLVASKDPELLETIKHQLHSFSAELPIKVQEATSLEELSNFASAAAQVPTLSAVLYGEGFRVSDTLLSLLADLVLGALMLRVDAQTVLMLLYVVHPPLP
jgi:hypothetical protein